MSIAHVIQHYYPDWDPPADKGREWVKCLCPFHAESNPSATVSYEHDAFNCFGCGVKGDVIKIIRHEEGCSYRKALSIAEGLSPGSDAKISKQSGRVASRPVFGESWAESPGVSSGVREVQVGIRSRPSPWT